jgi:multicomponent Na+:H+ antiporter subunit E
VADQAGRSAGPAGADDAGRGLILIALLAALWLVLSGHYDPLLLALGAVSVAFCAIVARRLRLVDREGHPYHLLLRALPYWGWLLVQIYKAAIDVSRLVLKPSMPIRPVLFPTRATQPSDLGHAVYANSITLTPGTVSVDLEPGAILVHALTEEGAADVQSGDMDRRVTRAFGGR